MIVLGIDPDLHTIGFGMVDGITPLWVGSTRVPREIKGDSALEALPGAVERVLGRLIQSGAQTPDLVVVETQRYHQRKGADVHDIMRLSCSTGICLGQCRALWDVPQQLATTSAWKGDVPKAIHQARFMKKFFGWEVDQLKSYSRPVEDMKHWLAGSEHLSKSDWKHVGDALGLALFGSVGKRV